MKNSFKITVYIFLILSVSLKDAYSETFTVSATVVGSHQYKHSSNHLFDIVLGEGSFRVINNQDTAQSFKVDYESAGNEKIRFSPGFGNNAFNIPANSYQVVRYRISKSNRRPRGEFVITSVFSGETLRIDPK